MPRSSLAGIAVGVLCLASVAAVAQTTFTVDAGKSVGPCDQGLWANIGYDPLWSSTVPDYYLPFWLYVRKTGAIRRIRCHNTFTSGPPHGVKPDFPVGYFGCDIYHRDADGQVHYVFDHLDDVLDLWVTAGINPIIELDFMPDALAEGQIRRNYGGGAVNAPSDYQAWQDLVEATVRHCVDRYGLEKVRQWRFEIWNEPDLAQYFIDGGRIPRDVTSVEDPRVAQAVARLNRMYDHAVAAVKAVDPQLKVGGPGIAGQSMYLAGFLDHCLHGRNDVTGQQGTALDFISWHGYSYVPGQLDTIAKRRRVIQQASPDLLKLELQQNEWGAPLGRREPQVERLTTRSFEAANVAKMIRALWDKPDRWVDLFLRWGQPLGSTDHLGWRTLSLIAPDGAWVPMPVLQAYAFLARFGPERLAVTPSTRGTIGCLAARTDKGVQLAIYNVDERDVQYRGPTVSVTLKLTGLPLPDGPAPVEYYRLDAEHGDVVSRWLSMQKPGQRRQDQAALRRQAMNVAPTQREAEPRQVQVQGGQATLTLSLPPNAVHFVYIGEVPPAPSFKPTTPMEQHILAGESEYLAAQQAGEGKVAAAMEAVARKYSDLSWGWRAWWWLARYYAGQAAQPQKALEAVNHLLQRPLRAFDRTQLLQWAADRAREAGDQQAEGRYLQEMEKTLNTQGATLRWALADVPGRGPRTTPPATVPENMRAGQRVRVGQWDLQLAPADRLAYGCGVALASQKTQLHLGVLTLQVPSARKAALEVLPYNAVAVWCNGRQTYRMRRARIRTSVYADLPLRAGTNQIAVLYAGKTLMARVTDPNGHPMPDVVFAGP